MGAPLSANAPGLAVRAYLSLQVAPSGVAESEKDAK